MYNKFFANTPEKVAFVIQNSICYTKASKYPIKPRKLKIKCITKTAIFPVKQQMLYKKWLFVIQNVKMYNKCKNVIQKLLNIP